IERPPSGEVSAIVPWAAWSAGRRELCRGARNASAARGTANCGRKTIRASGDSGNRPRTPSEPAATRGGAGAHGGAVEGGGLDCLAKLRGADRGTQAANLLWHSRLGSR